MTLPSSASFAQITLNNQSVDLSIENLVNNACAVDENLPRRDRTELEKTTHLLLLSSLIMGDRDEDELEGNDD